MYDSISIRRFKGLEQLDLQSLNRINLLGGNNSVGKTSVLEAIFLALDRTNLNMFVRLLQWRGTSSVEAGEGMWLPFFSQHNTSASIEMELRSSSGASDRVEISQGPPVTQSADPGESIRLTAAERLVSMSTANVESRAGLLIQAWSDEKLVFKSRFSAAPNGYGHHVLEQHDVAVPSTRILVGQSLAQREEAELFSQLDAVNGRKDDFLEAIRAIDDNIKDVAVAVPSGEPALYVSVRNLMRKIPLALVGGGPRRFASILLSVLSQRGGVVLIDEIENGIHHSRMGAVWKALNRAAELSNNQVIVTTHSYECLAAAHASINEAELGPLSYYRLQRRVNGSGVQAVRYGPQELEAAMASEFEVR